MMEKRTHAEQYHQGRPCNCEDKDITGPEPDLSLEITTQEQFNEKYKKYLEPGFYGLEFDNINVVKFLDKIFKDLIQIPGFHFSQIKQKFGMSRFYSSLGTELMFTIEEKINRLVATRIEGSEIPNNGWISVKDRLPDLDKMVFVWRGNGYSICKYRMSRDNWQFKNRPEFISMISRYPFRCEDVTHWMYLPKSPKSE